MIQKLINRLIYSHNNVDNKEKSTQEDDLKNDLSIKNRFINLFIKEEYKSDKIQNEEAKNNDEIKSEENTADSKDNESIYNDLSERENHMIKLEQLNREIGVGECPTCNKRNIDKTKVTINKNEINVHSCNNPSCHRYIYPGDRTKVGNLRYDLINTEQNIQDAINIK